jgi:predicted DNA-binding ribbon-helix-helix protein
VSKRFIEPARVMIRKTMRIGEVRTSIKLEQEFWGYLKEVADGRSVRLSRLVNDVAEATPERTNLASTLRTFCLIHAQLRTKGLDQEVEKLRLAGNSADLTRVLDACPLPCALLTAERDVRRVNQAFVAWLNLDPQAVLGHRLDNLMILRGANMNSLW